MHKALYRVYRPKTFGDVVGQEHIVKTLKNQIKLDKQELQIFLFFLKKKYIL